MGGNEDSKRAGFSCYIDFLLLYRCFVPRSMSRLVSQSVEVESSRSIASAVPWPWMVSRQAKLAGLTIHLLIVLSLMDRKSSGGRRAEGGMKKTLSRRVRWPEGLGARDASCSEPQQGQRSISCKFILGHGELEQTTPPCRPQVVSPSPDQKKAATKAPKSRDVFSSLRTITPSWTTTTPTSTTTENTEVVTSKFRFSNAPGGPGGGGGGSETRLTTKTTNTISSGGGFSAVEKGKGRSERELEEEQTVSDENQRPAVKG